MDISKITYCELDLEYDREAFCKEVDEYILPKSMLIDAINVAGIAQYSSINNSWGMVPEDDYAKPGSQQAWLVNSLIYSNTDNKFFKSLSINGSIVARNRMIDTGKWMWKPEYEDLALTKFVKTLPLTDIIHARTLCLFPGKMAAVHRDDRTDSLTKNLLSNLGYLSITLNLSDGGQPLFFSLTEDESTPIRTNKPAYVFNDFNLHGVPYVTDIRRQVRVTGKPTPEFFDRLKMATMITEEYDG